MLPEMCDSCNSSTYVGRLHCVKRTCACAQLRGGHWFCARRLWYNYSTDSDDADGARKVCFTLPTSLRLDNIPCIIITRVIASTIIICRIWGSHSGGYEEYHHLGYNAVQSVDSQPTFRRNISPPSSGPKHKPSKKATWKHRESRAKK
jgi:hypothetical protein